MSSVALPRPAVQPVHSRRILVVDDRIDAAIATALPLRENGHEVHIATNGAAALQVAAAVTPDVVVLDIGLPGHDAYAFARRLRAMALPHRPVLMAVTGYGEALHRQLCVPAGVDLYLAKPVEPDALLELLRYLCPSPGCIRRCQQS